MMSGLGSDFQSEILPTTIYVLIGFWIIQIIDNNLSQPIIFPKCQFTSLGNIPCDFDRWLPFGILGMIVAVPFYTIIKLWVKFFREHDY
jgi:predicted PurR-regulated permease PerM